MPSTQLTKEQLIEDFKTLYETIKSNHPKIWMESCAEFNNYYSLTLKKMPQLSEDQIIIRIMELVAKLNDAHSYVELSGKYGFRNWFPVKFHQLKDGVFILALEPKYSSFISMKVTHVNDNPIEIVLEKTSKLIGFDNIYGKGEYSTYLISSADILRALGFSSSIDSINIKGNLNNETKELLLKSYEHDFSLVWRFGSELFGPPGTYDILVNYFGKKAREHRIYDPQLPVRLRNRSAYWAIIEDNIGIIQFNNIMNLETLFEEFVKTEFFKFKEMKISKLIIDLRFNPGGNGHLVLPLVHEIIKFEEINQAGKIFVLMSRVTYSAAMMLVGLLKTHTKAIFAGEPAGSGLNNYGDPTNIILPNSEFTCWFSSVYHQLGYPTNRRNFIPVQIPYQQSSQEYFSNQDPLIELIKNNHYFSWEEQIGKLGFEDTFKKLLETIEYNREFEYYCPFSEIEVISQLELMIEKDEHIKTQQLMEIAMKFYPNSLSLLGLQCDLYLKLDQKKRAKELLHKVLKKYPFHNDTPYLRDIFNSLDID